MQQGDDLVGRTLLGRYRVVLPLAQGGMGMVYLARTEGAAGFAKPVVVKRVLPELVTSRTTVDLFVREAKILSNLQHPGVVNVLDFGQEEGAYVMVLEYVHGYDLGAWAQYGQAIRSPIPCEFVLYVLLRVLEALHHAHQCRRPDGKSLEIVHRDVSPGNVLLSLDGQVKLGDFGIARINDEVPGAGTQFGTFRGKFSYAAPELLEGHEATASADLYSAGVVLLELILGTNPYAAATVTESMHRMLVIPPPKLEGLRPDVPAGLDTVIARALDKDMEARFSTAGAFADALRKLLPRSEDQIAPAFVERINADFRGEMATVLELLPLGERDRAWREVQPDQRLSTFGIERATDKSGLATIVEVSAPELERVHRRSLRRPLLLSVIGAGVLAGSAAMAWWFLRSGASAGPDYVVIERQPVENGPDSTPSALAVSSTSPEDEAIQTANLSAALQRQQGRIQTCYEQHVADLRGSPRVVIRFELDASGKVQEASLEPTSLRAHPLGTCLLGVARATPFPAPGRPVSFRIPITARVMSEAASSGPAKRREAGP